MSRTKEMLENYYEYRRQVNQRRTGGITETADRPTPVATKKKNTDGLINNSQTYCYWTARGLQTLKEEYINNPFVTDLEVVKEGALSIIDSAKRVDSWYRFEAEIKAAKSKQEILELFERANYNGKHYTN
jgi:hypothetical protein